MNINFLIKYFLLSFFAVGSTVGQSGDANENFVWSPDNLDGTYTNPVIFADYSDPDVIRVEDDFYMVSSSFSNFPGLPVLHSKDLVNWKIISHAAQNYPFKEFSEPLHGNGIWSPSLRYHEGYYWIFFGDPDNGILMTKSKNPAGPWEPLHIVEAAKGWIDPCPFWDEDGQAYLVHAWAKSRVGFNGILTLNRMSPDGKKLLDEGLLIFDGQNNHPTIEGPKLYKRNGYYYIFAPAGGVKTGWQTVIRSKNIYGPYEDKIVLEQGSTNINGPHQGALLELESGESWFIHFQDRGAYGRVTHLNPVKWTENWPTIGIDLDGNGIGEPVHVFRKPNVGKSFSIITPQTSTEFDKQKLGLQWQWEALSDENWFSLKDKPGFLRLRCMEKPENFLTLRNLPNVLSQKFPGPEFSTVTKLNFSLKEIGESFGLVVLGSDYSCLEITFENEGAVLRRKTYREKDKKEISGKGISLEQNSVYLKLYVREGAVCSFAYSLDGNKYQVIGKEFYAQPGRWVGAKIGLYAFSEKNSKGFVDVDYIRFGK